MTADEARELMDLCEPVSCVSWTMLMRFIRSRASAGYGELWVNVGLLDDSAADTLRHLGYIVNHGNDKDGPYYEVRWGL